MTRKERRVQFRDYYLQPMVIGLFALCIVGFVIYQDFIARKKVVYECAIINEIILEEPMEKFLTNFLSFIEYDKKKETASFQTYYTDPQLASETEATVAADIQHISAQIYAATLDAIIADSTTLLTYQQSGLLMDFSQFLTAEEQKKLDTCLYRPENTTQNPQNKPYGIDLKKSTTYIALFEGSQRYVETPILVALKNSVNTENTKKLIYYLFPDILS